VTSRPDFFGGEVARSARASRQAPLRGRVNLAAMDRDFSAPILVASPPPPPAFLSPLPTP